MKVVLLRVQYIIFVIAISIAAIVCAPRFFINAAGTGAKALDGAVAYMKSLMPDALPVFLVIAAGTTFALFLALHITLMRDSRRRLSLDSLTGLNNLSWFETQFDSILYKNRKLKYSLILFEVEDYERYASRVEPEKAGHTLKIAAQTIDRLIRKTDAFARRGTCGFIVLYAYDEDMDIKSFIERVTELIKEVTLFSGFYKINDSQGYEKHMAKAESALRLAKRSSTQKSANYEDTMQGPWKKYIEDNMQTALETGELSMNLQPKFNLKDNRYCGAKALIRWQLADGTLLQPKDFIKIFEERGFIIRTDLYMVEQACRRIRRWIDAGEKPIPISLSISKKYFVNNKLIKGIVESIRRHNVPPELIELEIAETNVAITVHQLVEVGKEFQDREFLVDVESSDKGSSLLGIIDSIPAHYINLGRNMTLGAMENFKNLSLLKSITAILSEKGVYTVADGIETTAHLDAVKTIGCAVAYGFYFSGPISVNKFEYLVFGKVIG